MVLSSCIRPPAQAPPGVVLNFCHGAGYTLPLDRLPRQRGERSSCSTLGQSFRAALLRQAGGRSHASARAAHTAAFRGRGPAALAALVAPRALGEQRTGGASWRGATVKAQKGGGASEPEAVIVGGGLAGLAAARELQRAGIPFTLFEASDAVGGRVRTDVVDGFLLDRGFQIFLSAYPTCKEMLDYDALDLKPFYAGALVWFDDKFHRVADPFRHPRDGVASLPNPVGSVRDKALVGLLRLRAAAKSTDAIFGAPETTIVERLRAEGFSSEIIDRFFRPFFGGIFFDRELQTTSRLLEFVLKMLALGANTVPAGGIGAIPAQLAAALPPGAIRLGARARSVGPAAGGGAAVVLESGARVAAPRGAIVAVEGPEGARLLGGALESAPSKGGTPRSTVCLYFAAKQAPIAEPILLLNGTEEGYVNNCCFPSNVAPSYAPPGQALASVSLIGRFDDTSDRQLEAAVRDQLGGWFGEGEVASWRHLRTYHVPFAQPDQRPPTDLRRPVQLADGIFVCGDHRDSATFDGALTSGRRAAQALIRAPALVTA